MLGATGLIGAQVKKTLSEKHSVICVGRHKDSDIFADLTDTESLRKLNLPDSFSLVHCAGITDELIRRDKTAAFFQSTSGMEYVIDAAVRAKVKRFAYISTSHVYGKQEGSIDEKTEPNPLSDYAIAHYSAEQVLKRNQARFECSLVLRPNAVFGIPLEFSKFDRWSLIPYAFPLEAVRNREIELRSSGEQKRNFVGTQDIAECVKQFALSAEFQRFALLNPIGKVTMTVYDFAVLCCSTYESLTGQTCKVVRPEGSEGSYVEEFIYSTLFERKFSRESLQNSIEKLLSVIIEENPNGK